VSGVPTYEQLQQLVGQLSARVVELERIVREQADEIAELRPVPQGRRAMPLRRWGPVGEWAPPRRRARMCWAL
jgi:hypothetical protein